MTKHQFTSEIFLCSMDKKREKEDVRRMCGFLIFQYPYFEKLIYILLVIKRQV